MPDYIQNPLMDVLISMVAIPVVLAITYAMVRIAGECRADRKRTKAEAANRKAEADYAERLAMFNRAYPLGAPLLDPRPAQSRPWVIPPAYTEQPVEGIGDVTGSDCGTGTTPTLTTSSEARHV